MTGICESGRQIGEEWGEIDHRSACLLHLRPDSVVQASQAKRIVAAGLNELTHRDAANLSVFLDRAWLAVTAKEKALAEGIVVVGVQM